MALEKRTIILLTIIMIAAAIMTLTFKMIVPGIQRETQLRTFLKEWDRSDEEADKFVGFLKSNVVLPDDALDVTPYDEDTKIESKKLLELWYAMGPKITEMLDDQKAAVNKILDSRFEKRRRERFPGDNLVEENPNLPLPEKELEELAPMLTAIRQFVNRPGYHLEALASGEVGVFSRYNLPSGIPMEMPSHLCTGAGEAMRLQSVADARAGRIKESLDVAADIVKMSRVDPRATIFLQEAAAKQVEIGCRAWANAVNRCDDPRLLRQALELQNQLSLEFDKADSVKVLDSNDAIAVYREANRRGLRVRIPRRITGMELLAQSHELKSRYYREFVAPLYAKTTRVKDEAESPDSDPEQWDVDLYRMKGPIPKSAKERQNRFEYLWVRVGNMFLDASRLPKTRLQRRAVFDALHLATALKLYRLEHGASPVAMKDLIPQYLPAPVYDPYKPGANETFHYNGIFYSVGPDREDNHAETRWDMWVSYPRRSDIFFASSSVLTTPAAESQSQPIR